MEASVCGFIFGRRFGFSSWLSNSPLAILHAAQSRCRGAVRVVQMVAYMASIVVSLLDWLEWRSAGSSVLLDCVRGLKRRLGGGFVVKRRSPIDSPSS